MTHPQGTRTATPCRSCRAPKPARLYLCGACWASLSEPARRALTRRDNRALVRLRELHHHIDRGLPLAQLEITP
nr:hypothetical protein [Streptomyces sp. SID11385]